MSRLLRRGAVIGKVALVIVAAGVLLYAAAKVVNAEWTGTTEASLEKTPDTYLAEAQGALAAADIAGASDTVRTMITTLSADAETARVAERIAKEMAARGEWPCAREFYGYASQYAEGDTLKLALCGVARSEAEKGGDAAKAVEAAKRAMSQFPNDEKAGKGLMQAGDRLVKHRHKQEACLVYEAVADGMPAGPEGLKALRLLGVTSTKRGDFALAADAAERLMAADYRSVAGWARAVDAIAAEMIEQGNAEGSLAIYAALRDAASDEQTRMIADGGRAAALVASNRHIEAEAAIDALKDTNGQVSDPAVCDRLGGAYIGVAQYAQAIPYFQRVAAADNNTGVGWGANGKVIECAIRIGSDALVDETLDKMLTGYGDRNDKGSTFFDYTRRYVIRGRLDRARSVVARASGALQGDDSRWEVAAQAAIAIAEGAAPDEWIPALAPQTDGKTAGDALYEVGRALLYRGIQIESKDADARRLFAAADKVLGYVTTNCPSFSSTASAWHKRADCAQHLQDYGAAIAYAMTAVEKDPYYEYTGHCYIVAIESWHRIGRTEPSMRQEAIAEVLRLCRMARDACPDEKMVMDFVRVCEEGYTRMLAEGGAK